MEPFRIDHSYRFEKLSRAPVAEAVLDLRVTPLTNWNQDDMRAQLVQALPDYPDVKSQRRWQAEMKMQEDRLPTTTTQDHGLLGMIMRSEDDKQVAQFQHDGFSFSRLKPYEGWQSFFVEAMRLWQLYVQTTHPITVTRLGLRFINQIELQVRTNYQIAEILTVPPSLPQGINLPYLGFFTQEMLSVPETSLSINLIRTVDTSVEAVAHKVGVIVDIDVFTTSVAEDDEMMNQQITDMRWVKNKIFFSSITDQAKESMR